MRVLMIAPPPEKPQGILREARRPVRLDMANPPRPRQDGESGAGKTVLLKYTIESAAGLRIAQVLGSEWRWSSRSPPCRFGSRVRAGLAIEVRWAAALLVVRASLPALPAVSSRG